MTMDGFTVRTVQNLDDWRALARAGGLRMRDSAAKNRNLLARLFAPAAWVALVAVFVYMFQAEPPLLRPEGAMILVGLAAAFAFWFARMRMRGAQPDERGCFLGEMSFEFSATGFRVRRSNTDAFNQWSLVREVTETEAHVFLWIDRYAGYGFPVRDLPPGMTKADAVARLREFMAAAPAGAPAAAADVAGGAPEVSSSGSVSAADVPSHDSMARTEPARPSLLSELWAVIRLYGFRYVDGASLYGGELTLAALGAVSILLWIGLERVGHSSDAQFFWYALPAASVTALATLFLAWLLARLSTPRLELRRAALLVLGLAPLFVFNQWLVEACPPTVVYLAFGVFGFEVILYLHRGTRFMSGSRQGKAVAVTGVAAFALVYGSWQTYLVPDFWFEPDAAEARPPEQQRNLEYLVYGQSSFVDAFLTRMEPRVVGQPNLFFVGFAGYGRQQVFANEIELAARTVGVRYQAAQRTVLLENAPRFAKRRPWATPASLRHTLMNLNLYMDVDEDVLFLSLSSHGSEDATLSVDTEFGYEFGLWNDLDAEELAAMLTESKIRWKIIVISACYAGSFIDALKDDHTIILTAAAADRTSFGCADDSELTYFGEAFYKDSLPRAATLKAAFDQAREIVAAREKGEGIDASNPQAWFGEKMVAKLATMERAPAK